MEYLSVTSLVGVWDTARVGTSQYWKSHETVPTIQINYYIVEHVKKKKKELCAYERKATYTGTAAFPSYTFTVMNCMKRNVH